MIDILFDQFQRYNNVANLINNLREAGQTFSILEVGANEHQNLEKFLPEDHITYLDIQLPDNLKDNPKYLLGDATSMEFPDNKYNIVVALDVFEHIFPEDREKFIKEIYRVSSEFFVITAPFHSSKVVEAERRVNAVYKSIFNKDFIWLEEHMVNGLPILNDLAEYLDSQKINYNFISHGDVDIWEKMMTIHFVAAQNPKLGIYRNEIDRFYNQYIFNYDYVDESYRKICIATKKKGLSLVQPIETDLLAKDSLLAKLRDLESKFYMLAGLKNIESSMDIEDFVQIFLNSGDGFSEVNSNKIEFEGLEKSISMIYNGVSISSFRIDPSNFKGMFQLKNIMIRTSQETVTKEKIIITGNYNFVYEDKYVFYNDDPFIILELPEKGFIKEVSFDVMKLTHNDMVTSIIDYFNNQINDFTMKEIILQEKLLYVTEENSQLANNNKKIMTEINHFEISSKNLERMIEVLEVEKKEREQENKDLKEKNDELSRKNEEITLTNEKLEQNNLIYKKELEAIRTSKSWIYLSKFKKIIGK